MHMPCKVSKVAILKKLIDIEKKQHDKVKTRLFLGMGAEDCVKWLENNVQLHSYARAFDEQHITGAKLLEVLSDESLVELGVESEVDRKYMLLQLARVRERRCRERGSGTATGRLCSTVHATIEMGHLVPRRSVSATPNVE